MGFLTPLTWASLECYSIVSTCECLHFEDVGVVTVSFQSMSVDVWKELLSEGRGNIAFFPSFLSVKHHTMFGKLQAKT